MIKAKTIEYIVLLLLRGQDSESDVEVMANEARDMAIRALRAQNDPSWWECPGRPAFNKAMAKIRKQMGS